MLIEPREHRRISSDYKPLPEPDDPWALEQLLHGDQVGLFFLNRFLKEWRSCLIFEGKNMGEKSYLNQDFESLEFQNTIDNLLISDFKAIKQQKWMDDLFWSLEKELFRERRCLQSQIESEGEEQKKGGEEQRCQTRLREQD